MGYRKLYSLKCDECGYDGYAETASSTLKAARESAKADGWSNKGARDVCPECRRRNARKALAQISPIIDLNQPRDRRNWEDRTTEDLS